MGWWSAQRPEHWIVKKEIMTSSQTMARSFAETRSPCLNDQRWFWWESRTQTQSYGQHGRTFYAYEGGLYTTMLCQWPTPFLSPLLSGVCILSLLQTLEKLAPLPQETKIKWTNDLYYEDKKMSGVLVESFMHHNVLYVLMGFGLNLNTAQNNLEKINRPATSFYQVTGKRHSLPCVAACLRHELFSNLKAFLQDPAPFVDTINHHLAYMNQHVIIQTPQGWFSGLFQGINGMGQVRLKDQPPRFALSVGKTFETFYSRGGKPL